MTVGQDGWNRGGRQSPHPVASVIVPAHAGAEHLERALRALLANDLPRSVWELIVVVDGDAEAQAIVGGRFADLVVRLAGEPHGPAYARNRGAEVATGTILVFVDADSCLHPDALRRFVDAFDASPQLAALSGTYDTGPCESCFATRFRNHYEFYLAGEPTAGIFTTACGAVRRNVFMQAGMFDEWRFDRPQAEDRELGWRLQTLGHLTGLDPAIRATHLKRWTFPRLLLSETRDRSVPWFRVLIQRHGLRGVLHAGIRRREGWNALLMWLTLFLLPLGEQFPEPIAVAVATSLAAVLALDAGLYRFLTARCGIRFAVAAIPVQLARHLSSGVAFLVAMVLDALVGEPQPDPVVTAWAEIGVSAWPPIPVRLAAPASRDEQGGPASRGR